MEIWPPCYVMCLPDFFNGEQKRNRSFTSCTAQKLLSTYTQKQNVLLPINEFQLKEKYSFVGNELKTAYCCCFAVVFFDGIVADCKLCATSGSVMTLRAESSRGAVLDQFFFQPGVARFCWLTPPLMRTSVRESALYTKASQEKKEKAFESMWPALLNRITGEL